MEFDFGILQVLLGVSQQPECLSLACISVLLCLYFYLHLAEVCCERHLQAPQRHSLEMPLVPARSSAPSQFHQPFTSSGIWELLIPAALSKWKQQQCRERGCLLTHTHTFCRKRHYFCISVAQCLFFPEGQSFKVSLILLCRFGAPVP